MSAHHQFKLDAVINNDARLKFAAAKGKVGDGDGSLAVAVFHKEGFDQETMQGLFEPGVEWVPFLENDAYGGFTIKNPPAEQGAIRATFIHPATEKHVAKYTRQEDIFQYSENQYFSWVYNILEGKSEAERVCFRDDHPEDGFIMAPDLKWNGDNVEELYLLAIVNRHGIKSIRDLTGEHIPLLENILKKGTETIKEKYGVPSSKLKIFVHYHPSYNHFHVHFLHLNVEGFGSGIEKGHLLTTVISNLKIDPNYYKKSDLTVILRAEDPLKKLIEVAGKYDTVRKTGSKRFEFLITRMIWLSQFPDFRLKRRSLEELDSTPEHRIRSCYHAFSTPDNIVLCALRP
ncbi:unnamed protein product [Notodromas monacha]|uniref:m7GpppX diphosphatase n=1 Tax=Notodromas monacha TaxID=399045 RepID=A0A7R9C1Z3_9CRUS|nr:unnamed protein product [Notodromas monacha]CAG0924651.1 unnamed protein product [Notodromas monacha]